jgi:electron transport complex, G subunit
VKKDGGDIDSFTGATITPRAVTNQVNIVLHAVRDGTITSQPPSERKEIP